MVRYSADSAYAAEFIHDGEIKATLEYAADHKDDRMLLDEILAKAAAFGDVDWHTVITFRTDDHVTIEFQDKRVNKGLALENYAKEVNIPLDEIIAFGDLDNDIGLLEKAGWGVCLVNGSDATKAVAQDITEYDVWNDGVGRYLEKNWFKTTLAE
jgi:hydroxymethylpyrimidine pyrophosphatase-like HAD family hydrolase